MTNRVVVTLLALRPCLVRRPWWKFWGRERLGSTKDWVRLEMGELTPRQFHHLQRMREDQELNELLENLLSSGGQDKVIGFEFFGLDQPAPEGKPPQFKPWRPRT